MICFRRAINHEAEKKKGGGKSIAPKAPLVIGTFVLSRQTYITLSDPKMKVSSVTLFFLFFALPLFFHRCTRSLLGNIGSVFIHVPDKKGKGCVKGDNFSPTAKERVREKGKKILLSTLRFLKRCLRKN